MLPETGRIYTIREFYVHKAKVYIRLDELRNIPLETVLGPFEAAFNVTHFRPVQPRKTSIDIFESLLDPTEDETFRELEAEQFDYENCAVPR